MYLIQSNIFRRLFKILSRFKENVKKKWKGKNRVVTKDYNYQFSDFREIYDFTFSKDIIQILGLRFISENVKKKKKDSSVIKTIKNSLRLYCFFLNTFRYWMNTT